MNKRPDHTHFQTASALTLFNSWSDVPPLSPYVQRTHTTGEEFVTGMNAAAKRNAEKPKLTVAGAADPTAPAFLKKVITR